MVLGQEVNVVISQPELSVHSTKACFILSPVSVEVLTAILSALEDLEWKCMNLLSIKPIGLYFCVNQAHIGSLNLYSQEETIATVILPILPSPHFRWVVKLIYTPNSGFFILLIWKEKDLK